ncbi:MAG: hypothetical protein EHM64_14595 [Ignavibacteriae bacterium]|nr:MAG: hypothetical protein EHM64_14595 [Ignavibacteriota bacterium]
MNASSLVYKVAPFSSSEPGPHPALILLHGRGTDENDLLGLLPAFDPRLLVVSVRAPFPFSYGGFTWFDLDEEKGVDTEQLLEGCHALLRCMDELEQNYPIDRKRVFLFGFSMGAMIALTVSLLHPDRFKGVVAHSGLLPQGDQLKYRWNDMAEIAFFIAHGEFDPVVPVEHGRRVYERLKNAHVQAEYHEYPIQHTISDESLSDAASWLQSHLNPL